MGGKYPPLSCKEFKRALSNLGFEPRPRKGTSHEQWVGTGPKGEFRKVTVDCPKAPFARKLLKLMVAQTGYSKDRIYQEAFK